MPEKWVHIRNSDGNPNKCVVEPVVRDTDYSPVVHFKNDTQVTVTIQFEEGDAIKGPNPREIPVGNNPVPIFLAKPNEDAEHKYAVNAECFRESPDAGPKIIIPR